MTNVYQDMEEESKKGGNYLKMEPNDNKTVEILSDPVKGENTFQGKTRTEFRMNVRVEGSTDVLIWAVRQKNVMQQIIAIMKMHHLTSLVGQKMAIATRGKDAMTKSWFLQLVPKNMAAPGPVQPMAAPVADPQGVQWLEQQRQGMAQV